MKAEFQYVCILFLRHVSLKSAFSLLLVVGSFTFSFEMYVFGLF